MSNSYRWGLLTTKPLNTLWICKFPRHFIHRWQYSNMIHLNGTHIMHSWTKCQDSQVGFRLATFVFYSIFHFLYSYKSTYSWTLCELFHPLIHYLTCFLTPVYLFMLMFFFFCNIHECIRCGWLQCNVHFNLLRLISSLINSSVRWFHTFPTRFKFFSCDLCRCLRITHFRGHTWCL